MKYTTYELGTAYQKLGWINQSIHVTLKFSS